MIFGKLWSAFRSQVNKFANYVWGADPIAQMQYEYDSAVEQLKEGRLGLEQYRALVDRVARQTDGNRQQVATLESKIKAFLQIGDRESAAKLVMDLQRVKKDLAENESQLKMHEDSYNNHLLKVKHATEKLGSVKERIHKYDAELKMSKAEAEMAKLAQDFNFDVTTDFGKIESVLDERIGLNRAKAKVAADLSGSGVEDIKREQNLEKAMADQALREFEAQMGLATPETAKAAEAPKELGPKVAQ